MHPCIRQRTALFSITEQGESMLSRPSPVYSCPLPSKKKKSLSPRFVLGEGAFVHRLVGPKKKEKGGHIN